MNKVTRYIILSIGMVGSIYGLTQVLRQTEIIQNQVGFITQNSSFSCRDIKDISYKECETLKSLYDNTNGDQWNNSINNNKIWFESDTACKRYGIICNENKSIRSIDLMGNNLDGIIPSNIENLHSLESLILTTNKLQGEIPQEIGNINTLISLSLSQNNLIGTLPENIFNLRNLHILELAENRLEGGLSSQIAKLTNLQHLEMNNNLFHGEIPDQVWDLINLENLSLYNNQFEGGLSAHISNLVQLQYLYLNNNQLGGIIPPSLRSLKNLIGLNVSNNNFAGSIPAEVANLKQLKWLILGSNKFNGTIPSTIRELQKLEYFSIADNQFNGNVPIEIASLTNLVYLDLSQNKFCGNVPIDYLALKKLKNTNNFHENRLNNQENQYDPSIRNRIQGHNGLGNQNPQYCSDQKHDLELKIIQPISAIPELRLEVKNNKKGSGSMDAHDVRVTYVIKEKDKISNQVRKIGDIKGRETKKKSVTPPRLDPKNNYFGVFAQICGYTNTTELDSEECNRLDYDSLPNEDDESKTERYYSK